MYKMKIRILPIVFTSDFQSIATIPSYRTRQATNNESYHLKTNKQKNGKVNKT